MNNIYYVDEKIPTTHKISDETTFLSYANYWMEDCKNDLSEKTYRRYLSLLERINYGIGHIALKNIAPYHIKEFLKKLGQDGVNKRNGKKLSKKTILHHYRLISVILQQAVREQIIKYNPTSKDYMKPPKVPKTTIRCLQLQDVQKILAGLTGEQIKWQVITKILLFTGIRRGELCGLEWQDIDFDNKIISIMRSSLYTVEKGIYTKEPKTKSSTRIFSVSDKVLAIFYEYKEWYKETYGYVSDCDLASKRLFITRDKKPMHPDSINDWMTKFYIKNDIVKFTPHILRHTYISLLISKGVSIKEISERVGHSNLSTTCNIYAHSIKVADLIAANSFDNIIDIF